MMKSRTVLEVDAITLEVIKAGLEAMMLHKIFSFVFNKKTRNCLRMIINLIYQKREKLNPENYCAMALLFIPSKVFARVLLNRIRANRKNSETQYEFRPGRGIIDAIFTVWQIMEKAKEKVSLQFHLIDFKSASKFVSKKKRPFGEQCD